MVVATARAPWRLWSGRITQLVTSMVGSPSPRLAEPEQGWSKPLGGATFSVEGAILGRVSARPCLCRPRKGDVVRRLTVEGKLAPGTCKTR